MDTFRCTAPERRAAEPFTPSGSIKLEEAPSPRKRRGGWAERLSLRKSVIAILVLASFAFVAVAQAPVSPTSPQSPAAPKAPEAAAKEAATHYRYIVGGDSRDDRQGILPWAFRQAKARDAKAFIFLGDMELTPELDEHFEHKLAQLDPVPFYPVLGNHEVLQLGKFSLGLATAQKTYRERFLGTPRTPVKSSLEGRVVYSVDLAGGVHFVALDNVTQPGFGPEQLAWLAADLEKCRKNPATRFILVGMHKPLARNGITKHSMDGDGDAAVADSDAAVALFQKYKVSVIAASHLHEYDEFTQGGIPAYITGGLGAPVTFSGSGRSFHHFLQVDVDDALHVSVVRYAGGGEESGGIPGNVRNPLP